MSRGPGARPGDVVVVRGSRTVRAMMQSSSPLPGGHRSSCGPRGGRGCFERLAPVFQTGSVTRKEPLETGGGYASPAEESAYATAYNSAKARHPDPAGRIRGSSTS